MNAKIGTEKTKFFFDIGQSAPLAFILGPCVIEGREFILDHAEEVCKIRSEFPEFNFVFKSSYDKANRTSSKNFRGLGIDEGLKILEEVRRDFDIPIITDVHTENEAMLVAQVADVIQIPAFLCRQTDLLIAAGRSGKTVLIKKGQFLHPQDMKYAARKVEEGGVKDILLCERGSCFGYRDLVVDFRGLMLMRELGYPVVFDVTHSVQSMGGAEGKSSGNRKFVEPLARASVAFGVDALFLECHRSPDTAPSDGPNMITFDTLRKLLTDISGINRGKFI